MNHKNPHVSSPASEWWQIRTYVIAELKTEVLLSPDHHREERCQLSGGLSQTPGLCDPAVCLPDLPAPVAPRRWLCVLSYLIKHKKRNSLATTWIRTAFFKSEHFEIYSATSIFFISGTANLKIKYNHSRPLKQALCVLPFSQTANWLEANGASSALVSIYALWSRNKLGVKVNCPQSQGQMEFF